MSISEKRLSTTGRRMKYCRKIEKLKLSELADKIDVPIFILKSYETDKKQLPYELARRIANVLHTTAGYLLGWEADPLLIHFCLISTAKRQMKKRCLMMSMMMNHFPILTMIRTRKMNPFHYFMK